MKIIAFTGKKQSGKSTAVEYLRDKIANEGHSVMQINFKDALVLELRKNFAQLLDVIGESMDAYEYDGMKPWTTDRMLTDKPRVIRALMQNYGTEVRRGDDPDYWVKKWKERIALYTSDYILVDDVRFLNEAEAVNSLGGVIVQVVSSREHAMEKDAHTSETEMDRIVADIRIRSVYGDLPGFYKELDMLWTTSLDDA